jgi:hypothetical protein
VVPVVVEAAEVATTIAGVAATGVSVVAAVVAAVLDVAVLDVVALVLVVFADGISDSQFTVTLVPSMFADFDPDTAVFSDDWLVVTGPVVSNSV